MNNKTKLTAEFSGSPVRIGIIGGGPGALLAAYYLQQKMSVPYQAAIFEMSDRLGGKMMTRTFEKVHMPVEVGLKEIYTYPQSAIDPLSQLISDLGLELEPMAGEGVLMDGKMIADTENLKEVYSPETLTDVEKFIEFARSKVSPQDYADQLTVDNTPLDDQDQVTGADVLFNVKDPHARKYIHTAIHSDLADEPHRTSAKYLCENWLTNEKDYMRLGTVKGGNERFTQELAKRISPKRCTVLLEHAVKKVEKTSSGFTITAIHHGEEVVNEFDFVLVCLPNNYLMDIEWAPNDFSDAMLQHHQKYDFPAHYLCVSVLFEKQFWMDDAAEIGQANGSTSEALFDLADAIENTDINPSPAQIESGNYAHGKFRWQGLMISLENPKGSTRSGMSKKGTPWSVTLPHHYGRFLGVTSKGDSEQLDVFVGPNLDSDKVFVVEQNDEEGNPDEKKIMVGFDSVEEALQGYLDSFSDGHGQRIFSSIEEMTVDEFKKQLKESGATFNEEYLALGGDPAFFGWVTKEDGQHIYINDDGSVSPSGPSGVKKNNDVRLANGHSIGSDHIHILKELGKAKGTMSVLELHKKQPGLESSRGMYIKTAMPAQELANSGYVEKSGMISGYIQGVGAGYAGPGSASATSVEKDDPRREIYRLTEKGHELASKLLGGLDTHSVKINKPEEQPHDANKDYLSRVNHAFVMLGSARKELEMANGKPRLTKAAQEKVKKWEEELKKLNSHPGKPQFSEDDILVDFATVADKKSPWQQSWWMSDAFHGCAVYVESTRNHIQPWGVLSWLIAGAAAVNISNLEDSDIIHQCVDSLPDGMRELGQTYFIEGNVKRWLGTVNGDPSGFPSAPPKDRHVIQKEDDPRLFMVGDYLFDSTLNGVLTSAKIAVDMLCQEANHFVISQMVDDDAAAFGWVTTDEGQHIYIEDDGSVSTSGPKSVIGKQGRSDIIKKYEVKQEQPKQEKVMTEFPKLAGTNVAKIGKGLWHDFSQYGLSKEDAKTMHRIVEDRLAALQIKVENFKKPLKSDAHVFNEDDSRWLTRLAGTKEKAREIVKQFGLEIQ